MKKNLTAKKSRPAKPIISAFVAIITVLLMTSGIYAYDTQPEEIPKSTQNTIFNLGFSEMHINTSIDPFTAPRELWHPGTVSLTSSIDEYSFQDVAADIRGRGNSTWWFGEDKRPLRFRFSEPRTMLDSPYAHREWILLANHFDRSLLRNHTALFLGSLLSGMDFVPMTRMIHLYVNGEYMGVYQLTDERNIGPGRAPITLDDDPAVSEYMLEMDGRLNIYSRDELGISWVMVNSLPYDIRFPGGNIRTYAHVEYVQNYLYAVSLAIRQRDYERLTQLIDIPSFIDFYLVQEFVKNPDVGWSSVFMTIRGQESYRRLHMGPLWDFDLTAGNAYHQAHGDWTVIGEQGYSPYGISAAGRHYWFRGLMRIPQFAEAAAERWFEIRHDQITYTIDHIRQLSERHRADFERNFERHQIFGERVWREPDHIVEITNFSGQVDFLVDWLGRRADWLDVHFNNILAGIRTVYIAPTDSAIFVNGENVALRAYLIGGNNFFKLRDLAMVLNGTESQFDVRWDAGTGEISVYSNTPYTPVGGELTTGPGVVTAARCNNDLIISKDGSPVAITAYLIDDSNFVKLRDVMRLLDVGVIWDEDAGAVLIDTSLPYFD